MTDPLRAGSGTTQVTGIIIVDHGSRRAESNTMLEMAAQRFSQSSHYSVVEPAHMELAEPSIAQAFDRCVARGASEIIVFPYFLSPGRHWTQDIPSLASAAAQKHPGVRWMITAPFGLHPEMLGIIADRIRTCIEHSTSPDHSTGCDICESSEGCRFRVSG